MPKTASSQGGGFVTLQDGDQKQIVDAGLIALNPADPFGSLLSLITNAGYQIGVQAAPAVIGAVHDGAEAAGGAVSDAGKAVAGALAAPFKAVGEGVKGVGVWIVVVLILVAVILYFYKK